MESAVPVTGSRDRTVQKPWPGKSAPVIHPAKPGAPHRIARGETIVLKPAA